MLNWSSLLWLLTPSDPINPISSLLPFYRRWRIHTLRLEIMVYSPSPVHHNNSSQSSVRGYLVSCVLEEWSVSLHPLQLVAVVWRGEQAEVIWIKKIHGVLYLRINYDVFSPKRCNPLPQLLHWNTSLHQTGPVKRVVEITGILQPCSLWSPPFWRHFVPFFLTSVKQDADVTLELELNWDKWCSSMQSCSTSPEY